MRKLFGILLAAAFVVTSASVATAEEDNLLNWTFGMSTSYVWDANDPNGGNSGTNALFYANQESRDQSFNIDLMQLGVSGQRGAASYGATLDFGDLASLADNSSDTSIALQTAWLGYDMDMVGITVGRIGTPIGYEVLEPWGNSTISRSYGWQAQPINHDAVTAHVTMDMFEFMVGAVNNFSVSQLPAAVSGGSGVNDTDNRKGMISALSGSFSDAFNANLSGIYTDDFGKSNEIWEINGILHGAFASGDVGLSYAIEYTHLDTDPNSSIATPAGFTSSNNLDSISTNIGATLGPTGIHLRYEYVDDGGIVTPVDTDVHSVSIDLSWALVDGMDFRVEYRHDESDKAIFGDGGSLDDSVNIVQAQLVWYPEL